MASANQNIHEPISNSVHGRVKWFNVKAGYGFIKRNDTKDDIFVHKASILRPNPNHMVPSLDDSEEVVFDIIQGTKGFEAVNVTGPGRATVLGNSRAHRRSRRVTDRGYHSGVMYVYDSSNYGRGRGRDGYSGSSTLFSGGSGYSRGNSRGNRAGSFGSRGNYYGGTRMRGSSRGGGFGGRMGNNHFSGVNTSRFNENNSNY